MKRFLCLLIALSFVAYISTYSMSSNVIASEKKGEESKKHNNTAKDHVCGMEVQKDKAIKLEHGGKTYYFCSKMCEAAFKKDPSKYQKKEKEK